MNKNLVISIVVILLVIGAGWYLFKDQLMPAPATETMEQVVPSSQSFMETPVTESVMKSTESSINEGVKVFTVTGSNFKFDVPEIRVKAGDTVKITFKNSGGFHDFVIDEFKVKTKQGNGPSEETVTFVADKAGEYFFYCSVGQHRANGMEGKFIVE